MKYFRDRLSSMQVSSGSQNVVRFKFGFFIKVHRRYNKGFKAIFKAKIAIFHMILWLGEIVYKLFAKLLFSNSSNKYLQRRLEAKLLLFEITFDDKTKFGVHFVPR